MSDRDLFARLWKDIAQPPDLSSRVPPKYTIVRAIGTGGSASVYLAEDTALKRPVALKLLNLSDAASIGRFRREALMAAALDHPNIVKIFEAGEDYIAMQYIAGDSISFSRLALPETLRAVQKVAEALHYAHSKGMLHRDVKPGNILIDDRGEVFLTDFGLARETQGPGVSISGAIVGTPAYMSPEQARGAFREMDARSDVYSLGATLYELVTGKSPYEGESTFFVLQNVVASNLPDPKDLPRDLRVIILKAMAPEKDRRYRSAQEFAQDIGHYLAGEPIRARPASVAYQMTRYVKRRPVVVTLVAAVILALVLGAAALYQRRRAADAEEQALSMIRKVATSSTEAILAARRKGEGVRVVRDAMHLALRQAYDEAIKQAPNLAEPDYLMGRVERALMRDKEAEQFQERALAKDPKYAPAIYELVVLLSRRYGREYVRARDRMIGDRVSESGTEASKVREVKEPTRDEIEKAVPALVALRTRVDELCRKLENAALSEAVALSAKGLAAASLGKYEEARRLLRDTVKRDPLLEEAFERLAEISRDWEEAVSWYTEGLKHDAGYLGHWIGRGGARTQRANRMRDREGDLAEISRQAEGDFARAVVLDPECVDGWLGLGIVCINRAAWLSTRAQDPLPDLLKVVDHMTRALALDPESSEALIKRAASRFNQGVHKMNMGQNPLPDFDLAEADFERALKIEPDNWQGWNWRGAMYASRGNHRSSTAQDAKPDLELSEAAYTRVIELRKDSHDAWANRGYVRASLAHRRGELFEEFKKADADFQRAMEIHAESPMHWTMRADLYSQWAASKSDRGLDGSEENRKAEEFYTKALDLNPEFARAWARRGQIRSSRAAARMNKGEDPVEEIANAERDLRRSVELNPKDADTWCWLGRHHANVAYFKYRRSEDPSAEFERMEEAFAKGLEINRDLAELWMNRGFGRTIRGLHRQLRREDPLPEWKLAEDDLCTAIQIRPNLAWAHFCRAELRFNRGLYWERTKKSNSGPEFAQSIVDYEQAIKLNPAYEKLTRIRMSQAREKARQEY